MIPADLCLDFSVDGKEKNREINQILYVWTNFPEETKTDRQAEKQADRQTKTKIQTFFVWTTWPDLRRRDPASNSANRRPARRRRLREG